MPVRWSNAAKKSLPRIVFGLLASVFVTLLSLPSTAQEGTPGPSAGKKGMKGKKGPSSPAPRNTERRVTLGPGPGQKGFWGGGGSIVGRGGGTQPNLPVAEVPFQPWARALYEVRQHEGQKDDPHVRCLPPGGPRQFQTPNGFEFLEIADPKKIFILFGGGPRSWRVIYMDGRSLPPANEDRVPTYFGYSTGHWEGDTLVVESEGYNEKFWMHRGGLPHTDVLHLTERFSRPDYDTLVYDVTVNDPKAYTKPWTGGFKVPWTYTNWDGSPGGEIQEYFCQDDERDYQTLK
jgi:hypothetical protein